MNTRGHSEHPPRPSWDANFRKLVAGAATSNLGDGMRNAAFPLLAASLTRDPLLVSAALFAAKLPWLLFSLIAGAVCDRVDRRALIAWVNLSRGLLIGAFGLLVLAGWAGLPLLYAVAFVQGVGEVFADNGSFALMPSVVPRSELERANGRLEALATVADSFAGPMLGGVLFASLTALPFLADAATFGIGAALVFAIQMRARPGAEPSVGSLRREISEGLRWLVNHPSLRSISLISAATNLVLAATFAIAVLFALEELHISHAGFGILLTIEAVGGIAGALLAARLKAVIGLPLSIGLVLLASGMANLVIALSGSLMVVAAMMTAVAFCGGMWSVMTKSFRQSLVPDRLLGRVQSAHLLLSWGAAPLGSLLGGLIASGFGLRSPFLLAFATLCCLAPAAAVATRGSSTRMLARLEPEAI